MFDFLNFSTLQVKLGAIGSVVGTVLTYAFGWNDTVIALLCLMVFDWLSGVLGAVLNPSLALDSHIGYKGIGKKVGILLCVGLAHILSGILATSAVYELVMWFYIANEGLSILENLGKCGVPLPAKLQETLKQLQDKNNKQ